MAAVVAAIGAAFLAGAVALFREHRLQQRNLLVAARVLFATFGVAANGIRTSLKTNEWPPLNRLPGETSFSGAWETYRADLGGHLTWDEWNDVEGGVHRYLALMNMSQEKDPQNAEATISSIADALDVGRQALYPYCTARLSVWKLTKRRLIAWKEGLADLLRR
ncbi:MAG: hypothetical protein ACJ76B_03765 [Solirubrobacterales bacterium]